MTAVCEEQLGRVGPQLTEQGRTQKQTEWREIMSALRTGTQQPIFNLQP